MEGVIDQREFPNCAIHFTSAFDYITCSWRPILITIVFGRTALHYLQHWMFLFQCFGPVVNVTWETFIKHFLGVTMDWSEAQKQSFYDAMIEHAANLNRPGLTPDEVRSFLRNCGVHFTKSEVRVARNSSVVPADKTNKPCSISWWSAFEKRHHSWNLKSGSFALSGNFQNCHHGRSGFVTKVALHISSLHARSISLMKISNGFKSYRKTLMHRRIFTCSTSGSFQKRITLWTKLSKTCINLWNSSSTTMMVPWLGIFTSMEWTLL